MTVIADIGDSLFGAADLEMHRHTEFLSPAYYTSMGFGVPAAVGASMANPESRILVIVGDGAFQMTGHGALDDRPARPQPDRRACSTTTATRPSGSCWRGRSTTSTTGPITRSPRSSAAGMGLEVRTVGELDAALEAALANTAGFSLLNVHLDPVRPQPGPRAAGQPAVADRDLGSRCEITAGGRLRPWGTRRWRPHVPAPACRGITSRACCGWRSRRGRRPGDPH